MKRLSSIMTFAVAAIILCLTSCKEQASLTLGTAAINAGAAGCTEAVTVNSNYPWDAVVSDSWIVLHNTTGNPGDAVIGVMVMANTTGAEREGTITVQCEEAIKTITVRQSQNDALMIDTDATELTYIGGEVIVPVEANVEYTVVIPEGVDWITNGGTRALTATQQAITVAKNESEEDREAVVTFKNEASGITRTFYVKQFGFSPTVVIEHTNAVFTVPTLTGENVKATVMWGDGTSEEYIAGLSHEYAKAGDHVVTVIGKNITGYDLSAITGINSIDITEF